MVGPGNDTARTQIAKTQRGTPHAQPTGKYIAPAATSERCPGSYRPELSCEAISANAAVRQADAAEKQQVFDNLGLGLGLVTAVVAFFAAKFARSAAVSASKSYTSFVAAEDAHLIVEFRNGTKIESAIDGVRQPDAYFLSVAITNVGRSTARIHFCTNGGQTITIDKTLRRDESIELDSRVEIDSLKAFEFKVWYASPIRKFASLTVHAQPVVEERRIFATVSDTAIVDVPSGSR